MNNREITLKLLLDAIGEDTSIATVSDRLRLQKTVYMAQALGIPLSYSYSWYVKGPYSPSLTSDYYSLNAALAAGDNDTEGLTLNDSLHEKTQRLKDLLAVPNGVEKPQWYEAICSLHYLIRVSKKSFEEAKEFMHKVKPHLNGIVDPAHQRLSNFDLA